MSLFHAIHNENLEEVKRIIAQNAQDVSQQEQEHGDELTYLDCAIAYGNLEIARFFFEKGWRPNLKAYGNGVSTPIHRTVSEGNIATLKWVFAENILPLHVLKEVKCEGDMTLLDEAIASGNLEIVKFLWEKDVHPNSKLYRDRRKTPVHWAVEYGFTDTLEWVFAENILPLRVLNIGDRDEWTLLDFAIAYGKLRTIQYLWGEGVQPNLEVYRDEKFTPVHMAVYTMRPPRRLQWVFAENILPLRVLNVRVGRWTPLDIAINKSSEATAILRRILIDPVFLAMQRAKRDHCQCCVMRRLPNELLDMVVDEVAARYQLKVVW